MTLAFGIDIGGSGIKGAPVDLTTGEFTMPRLRIPTPQPATPEQVIHTAAEVWSSFGPAITDLPIGITLPSVVTHGITRTACNIDPAWIDYPAADAMVAAFARPVALLNDADAAGLAEARLGAARGQSGLVIVTTLGTGIGSALIFNGTLIPNSELGNLEIDGVIAEKRAAANIRTQENLSWPDYIARLQRYYERVEYLFSPDLFVVGGGISREADLFLPYLSLRTPIVAAQLRNQAGIVGAAWYAAQPA